MPYSDEYINHVFSYHPPQDGQAQVYETIRAHAREFFKVLNRLVPDSADKADALRSLRNCVMTANAGIATAGGPPAFQVATRDEARVATPVEASVPTRSPYQTTAWPTPADTAGLQPVAKQRTDGYTEVAKPTRSYSPDKTISDLTNKYLQDKGLA